MNANNRFICFNEVSSNSGCDYNIDFLLDSETFRRHPANPVSTDAMEMRYAHSFGPDDGKNRAVMILDRMRIGESLSELSTERFEMDDGASCMLVCLRMDLRGFCIGK